MPHPIIYVDTSSIRAGKLEQLKAQMSELASFVEEHVPRVLSYAFFLNESETEMTVVAVHPDSESLDYHLTTGKERFKAFGDYIDLLHINVYGKVSETVMEKLHKKAQMLGRGTVEVHEYYSGFVR